MVAVGAAFFVETLGVECLLVFSLGEEEGGREDERFEFGRLSRPCRRGGGGVGLVVRSSLRKSSLQI